MHRFTGVWLGLLAWLADVGRRARWTWYDWQTRLVLGRRLLPIGGGIDVPNAQAVAEKYVRVTSGRTQDYTAGIQRTNPGDFESRTAAAADTFAAGVQEAIAENRFAQGVQGSGARWRRKAEQLGSQRFPTGVTAARDDMAAGVAPYLQELQGIQLDPRRPRGDPANLQRVAMIAQRLNQRRRSGAR